MEEKTFFHSLMRTILGKRYLMMLTDASEIMGRQEEFEKENKYVDSFQKISESFRTHVLSGGALAIALSLSLQRYFPSKFSTFGLSKVLVDLTLITVSLVVASNMALKANNNELGKIKKELMTSFDREFLHHMADIQIKYDIDEEDQVRGIFSQEEYKEWIDKRHEHLF